VGVSTGGSIAQQVAAEHPDVVRRLVLMSTACRLGPRARASQTAVAEQLRLGRTRQAAATAVAAIAPWAGPVARGVGWVGASAAFSSPTAASDLLATLDAEDRFDLVLCADHIVAQTLIIGGGRDRFYTAELFRETADLIPGSQLLMVERRGHIGVVRDRRAVAQIAGFLTWERSVIDDAAND
jgi:pimeloyl-ACP methyl ester carboxylesterase